MRKNILLGFILILFLSTTIFLIYEAFQNNKTISKLSLDLNVEKSKNTNCNYKADSLLNQVILLSKYKSLSISMSYRDDATKDLKFKIGDVVRYKIDSNRVVITDVIIGGAEYNYYIHYKIASKDKEFEVIPELVEKF